MEENEMDWNEVEAYLGKALIEYVALLGQPGVNVDFALRLTFAPLCKRFSDGERSGDLLAEIMGISL